MIKAIATFCVLSFFLVLPSYSIDLKINGVSYSGSNVKVYAGADNIFHIESSENITGTARTSSNNFTVSSTSVSFPASNNQSSTSTLVDNKKLDVKVLVNATTRIGSTATIEIIPMLSTSSDVQAITSFGIINSLPPDIFKFELVNSNIKDLMNGKPIILLINGSSLDELSLNLPKNVSGKIIKNNSKEMLVQLQANKSFKTLTIDHTIFKVKNSNVKINSKAKAIKIK